MENISPTLKLVLALRLGLERGEPIKISLRSFLRAHSDEFSFEVSNWLGQLDRGMSGIEIISEMSNPYRRALLEVVSRGLRGEAILSQMISLEEEIRDSCRNEIETFASVLPLKALVPLLLFQFPAILILMFGPLLRQMFASLP